MATCLYIGRVDHSRFQPREHRFHYRMALLYLDLDTQDADLARFPWLMGKVFSPLRFRRGDHLGEAGESLAASARRLVAERTGVEPSGPVRLLTGFGFMAFRFNPVSFYYCFDANDRRVEFVIAEVTNTPWLERHCYVLDFRGQGEGALLATRHGKGFHVSPFMPMDTTYDWRLDVPGETLRLAIAVGRGGEPLFSAGLRLERRPFTRGELLRAFAAMPFTTLKVVGAIYWQALRLWLKGARFHPHPESSPPAVTGEKP
ncbi:MAG: DUF1365 domain-containing protein [Porticoccaceae bacterium]|nr:DUF1365 domain-containing protein [Porticoccaceae bacterium]